MSVIKDLAELLDDTGADDLLVFVGLKSQPINLPNNTGGRKVKRAIHFIRRHSFTSLMFGWANRDGLKNGFLFTEKRVIPAGDW